MDISLFISYCLSLGSVGEGASGPQETGGPGEFEGLVWWGLGEWGHPRGDGG